MFRKDSIHWKFTVCTLWCDALWVIMQLLSNTTNAHGDVWLKATIPSSDIACMVSNSSEIFQRARHNTTIEIWWDWSVRLAIGTKYTYMSQPGVRASSCGGVQRHSGWRSNFHYPFNRSTCQGWLNRVIKINWEHFSDKLFACHALMPAAAAPPRLSTKPGLRSGWWMKRRDVVDKIVCSVTCSLTFYDSNHLAGCVHIYSWAFKMELFVRRERDGFKWGNFKFD